MLHRRSTATALVAVLLPLAAALTSCGFDYPTDRVNTIAAGVNDQEASVDVLGIRVLAFADGQGRLIGSLAYNENDAEEPAVLEAVKGDQIEPIEVEGVEVAPGRSINLANDDVATVAVEGEFSAGEVITLTFGFSTGESATVDAPVVKPCGQYADITSPEFDAAAEAEVEAAETEAEETEAEETEHIEEADATYLCEHPTEHAEEEGGH